MFVCTMPHSSQHAVVRSGNKVDTRRGSVSVGVSDTGAEELEFSVDATTFDVLTASWIKNDNGATHIRLTSVF